MNQPAAQYPTAEEFVARWEQLPHAERLATAERMLTSASMAADCFMADHTGRLAHALRERDQIRAALLEHAPLAVQFNSPAEIIRGLRTQRDLQRQRAERAEYAAQQQHERADRLAVSVAQLSRRIAAALGLIRDDRGVIARDRIGARALAKALEIES